MPNQNLPGLPITDAILRWIEATALFVEMLAVIIIALAIVLALARYVYRMFARPESGDYFILLKTSLGRALLLGLEILVAADIIRTVALDPTMESVLTLGLLVLVRTFLSWALVVEIDGRWPWQSSK